MNWPGLLFGLGMAAAITGAAGAAFMPRLISAALAIAVAAFGVAAMCLTLGADYVAIIVAVLLGALVPAAMIVVAVLAPPHQPDIRLSPLRRGVVAAGTAGLFLLLSVTLSRRAWPAAGGQRQTAVEWIGSRLLAEDLPLLIAVSALVALAAMGTVALLRPRTRRR